MTNAELGGFGEPPHHPLDSTQMFAGPNDGLSQTCNVVSTYIGLRGHSLKAGYRVIFPTLDMSRYLEIAEADILETEDLSPAASPFGALGGTRVSVRETARIVASQAVLPFEEVDGEFDLDIRLGASGWSMPSSVPGEAVYAPGYEGEEKRAADPHTQGEHHTCHTCKHDATCHTCETQCEQATCVTCADKGCPHPTATCCKEPPGTCM